MSKKKNLTLLSVLIIFSTYCALTIGQSFDEEFEILRGKITLNYLLSFGDINEKIKYRENYSTIYWSFVYFFTEIFPSEYQIKVSHLINLLFSFSTIFAIGKFSKELFNAKVGKLVFLILFFYPIFFGHMAFNNKDMILAFSHVWIAYLLLKYLKNQHDKNKINKYIFFIGILTSIATGIQLVFLGSLIPIILFLFIEVFFLKKIIVKNFSKKKFLIDLIKCFIIFYVLLILFWIDVHENIFIYPFTIFHEMLSTDFKTGWPWSLVNGEYYLSKEVPVSYFLINFIYKSPEYFLILYIIFLGLFFNIQKFYKKRFEFFIYKLSIIIFILVFPNLILFIIPFPVYDGMRLFLWTLPYFCIIPGLTFYYLIENFKILKVRVTIGLLSLFIIYYIFTFFSITPYQYTYLNFLNGENEYRYKKFENDYWGTSMSELIKNAKFESQGVIKISTCGVNDTIIEKYLNKKKNLNYKFVSSDLADYVIMTNRVMFYEGKENCFEKFKGDDINIVKRNGLILSTIRKVKSQ